MSDYYIRITDEEPIDMKKGIRFRYNGTGSEAEFTIVDSDSYAQLVEQFNNFSNDFTRAVNYNLDNLLTNGDKTVAHSGDTTYIKDPNSESKYSYSDISSNISATNSLSTSLANLTSTVSGKVATSDFNTFKDTTNSTLSSLNALVTSLGNSLNGKASESSITALQNSIDTLNSKIADSGWVDIDQQSLQSGFTKYSEAYKPEVRKIGKVVHIRGVLKKTSNTGALTNLNDGGFVFILPSGYEPSKTENFLMKGNGTANFLLQISKNGTCGIQRYVSNNQEVNIPINAWLPLSCTYFID